MCLCAVVPECGRLYIIHMYDIELGVLYVCIIPIRITIPTESQHSISSISFFVAPILPVRDHRKVLVERSRPSTMPGALYIIGNLRSGFTAAVGTQFVLTVASIGYACGMMVGGTNRSNGRLITTSKPEEVFDAHHYSYVTEFVTKMYAGRGMSHPYVKMKESMAFEDPAARCLGAHEAQEAFRILVHLEPRSMFPPRCVDVKPQGESIALSYALHQQYLGGRLELPSLLVVTVQLRQRKDVPESEFLVLKMEEQWNGIPLIDSYLFSMVRRINGFISYQMSTRFL